MPKQQLAPLMPDEIVMDKIYLIRGQKIMMDRDLAELYGVETKRLKEAVRRNISRFPEDFMFEMDEAEFKNWRTQIATSKQDRQGLRYAPFCFTEQGVTMLSCILNSERAITVNIQIIRIFTRMREMIVTNKDILLQLERLEKKVTQHDEDIQLIFECLKQLLTPSQEPRKLIGFKRQEDPVSKQKSRRNSPCGSLKYLPIKNYSSTSYSPPAAPYARYTSHCPSCYRKSPLRPPLQNRSAGL